MNTKKTNLYDVMKTELLDCLKFPSTDVESEKQEKARAVYNNAIREAMGVLQNHEKELKKIKIKSG